MVEEGHPFQDRGIAKRIVSFGDQKNYELDAYSCFVLPRRVVFSFWEVTVTMSVAVASKAICKTRNNVKICSESN
jgi:hypothetical protein